MEQYGLEVEGEEFDRIAAEEEADFLVEIEMEREFYLALGISKQLFDLTQRLDKGVLDGGQYEFLLLSAKAFEFFGIKNIINADKQTLCNAEKLLRTTPYLLINEL